MAFNPFQWTISSFISESVHNIKETPSCRRSPFLSFSSYFFFFPFSPSFLFFSLQELETGLNPVPRTHYFSCFFPLSPVCLSQPLSPLPPPSPFHVGAPRPVLSEEGSWFFRSVCVGGRVQFGNRDRLGLPQPLLVHCKINNWREKVPQPKPCRKVPPVVPPLIPLPQGG